MAWFCCRWMLPERVHSYVIEFLRRVSCLGSGGFWLCHRKWLMLFSSKFQRNNQQNALAVDPAKGKTG